MSSAVKKRRICVLGSRSVGKSALVVQYVEGHFIEPYFPTIESIVFKNVNWNGENYEFEIIDTAGQDEYSMLSSRHAIGIHGFILVYSVASRPSFEMIRAVHDKILNYHGVSQVPCVIVGQKSDLPEKKLAPRQVTPQEGQALAKELHAAWIETSASSNVNVAKVFDLLLQEVEQQYGAKTENAAAPENKCTIM